MNKKLYEKWKGTHGFFYCIFQPYWTIKGEGGNYVKYVWNHHGNVVWTWIMFNLYWITKQKNENWYMFTKNNRKVLLSEFCVGVQIFF